MISGCFVGGKRDAKLFLQMLVEGVEVSGHEGSFCAGDLFDPHFDLRVKTEVGEER